MPVVSLPEIMDRAFQNRYGVAAFNTVDDITMDGVIQAAERSRSPLIIQVSVKTVKFWGADVVRNMFARHGQPGLGAGDACTSITAPTRTSQRSVSKAGWNSVLFDGSGMSFDENFKITQEIVQFAKQLGASVEGEVVAVAGVEDGMGSDNERGAAAD